MRTKSDRTGRAAYPHRPDLAGCRYVLVVLFLSLAAPSRALLMLSDNFTPSAGTTNINLDLAQRQGGLLATVPWTEHPLSAAEGTYESWATAINLPGEERLMRLVAMPHSAMSTHWQYQGRDAVSGWSWASPNHNFTEYGSWRIEFDADISRDGGDWLVDHWVGMSWGSPGPGGFVIGDWSGFIARKTGWVQLFDSGQLVGQAKVGEAPRFRLQIGADAAFDGSGTASWTLLVRSGGNPAFVPLFGWDRPTGYAGNYLTWWSYNTIWDAPPPTPGWAHDQVLLLSDLTIDAVPEPATLLWMLGGAWLVGRRKRRAIAG